MSPVQSQYDHENEQPTAPDAAATPKQFRFDWKWLSAGIGIIAIVGAWNWLGHGEPKNVDELITQSLQFAQAGRYQQCIDAGRQALKVKADSALAYNNVGWCYGKLGNWDEALRNMREAQRLDPNLEIARNNLAWIVEEKSKSTGTPADAELNASNQHALAGRYPECIASARKALQLHPSDAIAYNNIGWCSAKLGQWSEAYENLRESLKIQPASEIAANNRRWVVEEMAKRGQSIPR